MTKLERRNRNQRKHSTFVVRSFIRHSLFVIRNFKATWQQEIVDPLLNAIECRGGLSRRRKATKGGSHEFIQRSRSNQDQRRRYGPAVLDRCGTKYDREFQKTCATGFLRWHDFPSDH